MIGLEGASSPFSNQATFCHTIAHQEPLGQKAKLHEGSHGRYLNQHHRCDHNHKMLDFANSASASVALWLTALQQHTLHTLLEKLACIPCLQLCLCLYRQISDLSWSTLLDVYRLDKRVFLMYSSVTRAFSQG